MKCFKIKFVTNDKSFPVAIAVTDSRQPVVEKVQQLPQAPFNTKYKQKQT